MDSSTLLYLLWDVLWIYFIHHLWGTHLEEMFLKGYERGADELTDSKEGKGDDKYSDSDSSSSRHSTASDCVRDCNNVFDSGLETLVSKREWIAVYGFLQEVLVQDGSVKDVAELPNLHPSLYLRVYREHIVDLLLNNKESEAFKLYDDKVHALQQSKSGYAVEWKVTKQVKELFNMTNANRDSNPVPTRSAKVLMRIDFYLRLYCGNIYGHTSSSSKSHLWQFVIQVPKKSSEQLNPSYRCLACGAKFTNCTISKFRDHMQKKGKFPMCRLITMDMRLRYALGETAKPETSKSLHTSAKKTLGGGKVCVRINDTSAKKKLGGGKVATDDVDTHEVKRMRKDRKSAKKSYGGGCVSIDDVDTHQAKRMRKDRTSAKKSYGGGYVDVGDADTQQWEKTRTEVAKYTGPQEGRALVHLVNGVCSNIAAFYELFGERKFTLAVKSDLNVAKDMICHIIQKQPEIGETLEEGTELALVTCSTAVKEVGGSSEMAMVMCHTADKEVGGSSSPEMAQTNLLSNAPDKFEDDSDIRDLATVVRKNAASLFKIYREKRPSQECERQLVSAKKLLSKMVPSQK